MSLEFTESELAAIRAEYCKGATDTQFELFISECRARSLRPGPHVIFQLRNAKEWDADTGSSRFVKKPYWITTIGALRLIALRTGQYGGSTPAEYIYLDEKGDPTVVSQIPLPDKVTKGLPREPWAVRISVKRKDFDQPITSVVRFDSVAATQKRGETLVLTDMWQKRGDAQNAKCSEADALRKAFPEELGSLYLSEEIKNEVEDEKPQAVTPASVVPLPPQVPKVNQEPAVPTEAPRPNETKVEYHTTSATGTLPEHSGSNLVVVDQKTDPPIQDTSAREAAIKAVPDLKPASELSEPKKKPGRKPKNSPINGQGGITDEDISNAQNPTPEFDHEANQQAAQEFVEGVTSFTKEEAVSQGLPEPVDPLPDENEKKTFADRARGLSKENGVDISKIGVYTLGLGKKTSSKYLTVGDWLKAFGNMDQAVAAGNLKELLQEKV